MPPWNAKAAKAAKKYCPSFASFAASAFYRDVRSSQGLTRGSDSIQNVNRRPTCPTRAGT